jgi:hypothetical protein
MNKLIFNKTDLIKKFLDPISRVSEGCVINIEKDNVASIIHSTDLGVILYAKITSVNDMEIKLNVGDLKKFIKLINCINQESIELLINSNNIGYESDNLKFKYHMLEDNVLQTPKISLEKLKKLEYDTNFTLTNETISNIMRGNSFGTDANKIYFYTKDNQVYAELTDQAQQNVDSVTFKIADKYNGTEIKTSLPFKLEILQIISSIFKLTNLEVKINTKQKFLSFEFIQPDFELKYIVQGLVK